MNSSNIAGNSLSNQTDRPDAIGSPNLGSPTLGEFFNTAAFVQQLAGTVGTEGRNALHGPHFRHVDMSLFKDFPIHEAMKVQFRAECFNISNTPSFANPGATLGNGNFGHITNLNINYTPREFQFVMKSCLAMRIAHVGLSFLALFSLTLDLRCSGRKPEHGGQGTANSWDV